MTSQKQCAACGSALPADAPQGLCPACLFKQGLQVDADATEDAGRPATGFTPPAPAELAADFPDLEILELIGRGGMGIVYKARQKQLGRIVALKILSPAVANDPAFAERFSREARALALLNHPHIVAVYDFGRKDDLFYFLMEYVDGANLRQLLDGGRLAPREALAIVPQICDALQYAHDHGVVHRDIKPENLLLDKRGQLKIADFGLAKLAGRQPHEATLTGTGQVMGTLHYMAPEQTEHPQQVD
ncbi:MAG: serine/threonine protein kinase, partial [Pirellulaceae bacterium]|nr:serine/threonine protein kinase [Pirellulaceae bacterium]